MFLLLDVCQGALTAVLTVLVLTHKDSSTAVRMGALHAQASHLVILIITVTLYLIELKHTHGNVLVTVGRLLGSLVGLALLLLLLTSVDGQKNLNGGVLCHVVLSEGALKMLTRKDEGGSGRHGDSSTDLGNRGGLNHNGLPQRRTYEQLHLFYLSM